MSVFLFNSYIDFMKDSVKTKKLILLINYPSSFPTLIIFIFIAFDEEIDAATRKGTI